MLSCDCGYEFDWYYQCIEAFVPLQGERRKRCSSCKELINIGSLCLGFYRERSSRHIVEERIYGDMVPLAPYYLCEKCGEIFLNLKAAGYCMDIEKNMNEYLKEYWELTGFKKVA